MSKKLVGCMLGLALSLPVAAGAAADPTPDEIADLRQQVQALLARIEQLERNVQAPAVEPPASAMPAASGMDWAGRLRWKGDLRYRHEQFDIEGVPSDRVRQRIRARLGLEAKLSDTISAGFQIASGDPGDPRSTNATLDDANQRKSIGLDLAYVNWKIFDGAALVVGKQKKPWFEPGESLFFDGDVNPEGIAFRYGGKQGGFASVWGLWLEESSSQADSNLVGAQLGYQFADAGLTLAAGYWDYGAVKDQPILSFADSPAGNSFYTGNANCSGIGTTRCYLLDYDIVVLDAEWTGTIGGLAVMAHGSALRNLAADSLDTGFNLGFRLGDAGAPGGWQFGAIYQQVERDAQFGALLESDFAGGDAQGRGFQFHGAWVPVKNVLLKATYFLNERSYDTPVEADYRRLQLDLSLKF